MIETSEGLENVEEICRVPGLSGIYVGPGDLSLGLGMDGKPLAAPEAHSGDTPASAA